MKSDFVIGIDEVGVGSWAGPAFCSFVRAEKDCKELLLLKTKGALKDSKKLAKSQRLKTVLELNELIKKDIIQAGLIEISVEEINKFGIYSCITKAHNQIINQVDEKYSGEHIILDGKYPVITPKNNTFELLEKADTKIVQVMAAALLAKEYRDALMTKLASDRPEYGWDTNFGYGTNKHTEAIKKFGICDLHRKSFKLPGG